MAKPEPSMPAPYPVRFGVFEADLQTQELRKSGTRIRLEGHPFQILALLLEKPGQLVTREELQEKLWPADTFVDFEHSINTAVNRLREVLGDSAETPRFIETLPRRGYRFIYPANGMEASTTARAPRPVAWRGLRWAAGLLVIAIALAGILAVNIGGLRDRLLKGPTPQRVQSIGVLPLRNLSGDPNQDYFADGMTDALITELGKISALRVVSLQTMLRYKETKKAVPEIASELKVDALVEGSVVRAGNQVRIDAQLVQAKPERHIWAESFQRNGQDVLLLQGEVALAIAKEIRIATTPDQRAPLARARSVSPTAYEAWLRGRELYRRYSDEWYDSAIDYLQKAIRVDPTYAPPYATLAEVYCTDMRYSYEDRHALAESAAAKALELDEALAEAHAAQGLVNLRFRWDWAGAEREFKRAIELNSNSEEGHVNYGYFLTLMGRFEEGIATYRRAIELDPLNYIPNQRLAWAYGKAGRDDEDIAQLRELEALEPGASPTGYELAHVYARKKMYREALAEVERVKCNRLDCGWVMAVSGKRKEARDLIGHLISLSKRQYVDPFFIALTYAGLGERDEAIKWLEQGYRMRCRWMIYLKVVRELDPLRDDPRFNDLLRRMNFPQ